MRTDLEDFFLGTDDEFNRRLNERYRHYLGRIRNLPSEILSLFTDFLGAFMEIFLKQYIAASALVSSAVIGVINGIFSTGERRFIIVSYSVSVFICTSVSIIFDRGAYRYFCERKAEKLEQQHLIEHYKNQRQQRRRCRQEAGQFAEDRTQFSECTFSNSMEQRPENEADFASSGTSDELSEHLIPLERSSTVLTRSSHFSEESYNSERPTRGPIQARLAAEAINFFGPPIQIFGADSYKIVNSSGESIALDDQDLGLSETQKNDTKEKTFETSVIVHHPDSFSPKNSGNENSNSVKPVALERDESVVLNDPASDINLPCMDYDKSSGSAKPVILDRGESVELNNPTSDILSNKDDVLSSRSAKPAPFERDEIVELNDAASDINLSLIEDDPVSDSTCDTSLD